MSLDRFGGLGRAALVGVLACTAATLAQSCGFPDHTFVSDDEFYGKGGGAPGSGGAPSTGGEQQGTGGSDGGSGGGFVQPADGGPTSPPDSGPGTGGASPGEGGPSTDGAPPTCSTGLSLCGDTCVDFLTDVNHCGDCPTQCAPGEVCANGECAQGCTLGLTECTPAGTTTKLCVDTSTDENHCSRCNVPCAPGNVCVGSQCVVDCGTQTRCGTVCVDVTTDDTHCGNCTTNCRTVNQVCSGGVCKPNCTPPFIACGSTCVNPNTDAANCNGCGKPCGPTQACVNAACQTLVENCQNGTDDDRDGAIDCADTDCTPRYACASLPSGWQGPVAVWAGNAGAAPSCSASGGYSSLFLSANAGLVVPSYSCPACGCTKSAGMFCDDLAFDLFGTTDCNTGSNYWTGLTVPANGACDDWMLCSANPSAQSARLSPKPGGYAHGSCTPTQGTPQFPATSWSAEVRGCGAPATTGGGCNIGQCVPKPAAPFGATLCIFRPGIASCPAEYPVQRPSTSQQYYQSVLDGRSCSACTCDPQCGGTVSVFTTPTCSGTGTPLKISGANTCVAIPVDDTQSSLNSGGCASMRDTRSFQWTNAGAVCAASTSEVRGAPTPESPVTVCCQSP